MMKTNIIDSDRCFIYDLDLRDYTINCLIFSRTSEREGRRRPAIFALSGLYQNNRLARAGYNNLGGGRQLVSSGRKC